MAKSLFQSVVFVQGVSASASNFKKCSYPRLTEFAVVILANSYDVVQCQEVQKAIKKS